MSKRKVTIKSKNKSQKTGNWGQAIEVFALLLLVLVLSHVVYNAILPPNYPYPLPSEQNSPSSTNSKPSGWYINETVVLENKDIIIHKNIYIMPNGSLVVKHSKLFLNRAIVVYSGGNLTLINSLLSTYDFKPSYTISVAHGAKFSMVNSTILYSKNLLIKSDNAIIINSSFRHCEFGVMFQNVTSGFVANSTFYEGSFRSIWIDFSNNITLVNNTFHMSATGVYVCCSQNIEIHQNVFYNTSTSVGLFSSSNCSIIKNRFYNTSMSMFGYEKTDYNHEIMENTINDLPLIYVFNKNNLTFSSLELGELWLLYSSNIYLQNVTIKGIHQDLYLMKCSNVTILNSRFEGSMDNIVITNSNYTRLEGNVIVGAVMYGLIGSENNHLIVNSNNVTQNRWGISLSGSSDVIIRENIIQENLYSGVILTGSQDVILSNNTIIDSGFAISISHSRNISITDNLIKDNYHGLSVSSYNQTKVVRNTFVGNQYAIWVSSGRYLYLVLGKDNEFIQNTHLVSSNDSFSVLFFLRIILFSIVVSLCFIGPIYMLKLLKYKPKSKNTG